MDTKQSLRRADMSPLALSAWPLRRKVALALAIPLALAGTFGALRVRSDLVEASNSSSSARQVTVLRPAAAYLTAAERAMVAAVSADGSGGAGLQDALAEIRRTGSQLQASEKSADLTAEQRYQVDAVLDLSQALRAGDARTLSPGTWLAQLRQLQSGVTQLVTTIVNAQITPEPGLELLSQSLAGRFSLAMQQALAATDRTGDTASLELFSEFGAESAAIDRLASALGSSEKAVASLRTANAQRFREVRTGGTNLGGARAYAAYDQLINTLQDRIDRELEAAAGQARTDALVNAVITVAALAAAVLLALLVSRLLLVPIRRVRQGALAVAHEELPEAVARIRAGEEPGEIRPIAVTTHEEIGQLARAVDDMHRQAVVLASGEARLRTQVSQMFVTLSRRSTSLVNQQLKLIELLEQDEEDSKRLASLFRLDHLAARMRRTADSLLILADAPPANAAVDGVTVSDALQAATSGVQDYQRVRIRSGDSTRVAASAAADVVHLLTELVDNALTYSPPTSTVAVASRSTDQGVVVEITDAGLGMPAEQLAEINESLRSGGEVTPDTARRMGLFVVSRLSQRHGLTTSLTRNDEGGITATVLLPVALLPGQAPPPVPSPRRAPTEPTRTASTTAEPARPEPAGPGPARLKIAQADPALDQMARVEPATGNPGKIRFGKVWRGKARPGKTRPGKAEPVSPAAIDVTAWIDASKSQPFATAATSPPEPAGSSAKPSAPRTALESDLPTRRPRPAAAESPREDAPEPVPVPPPEAGPQPAPSAKDAGEPAPVPVRVSLPEPQPAPAVKAPPTSPSASAALDGEWSDPGADAFDPPIFRALRSAWLSSGADAQPWRTSEIEAGWLRADTVAATEEQHAVSESGLPVRRPGSRLVPGGVAVTATAAVRDPEAIRARLTAHAAGVSRGRAATAAPAAPDPSAKEAGS